MVALFIVAFFMIPKDKLNSKRKEDEHFEEDFMDSVPVISDNIVGA